MTSPWARYLLVGVTAAGVDVLLPVGAARDAFYVLVASSGSAAIVVGARRNRPAQPIAWYLLAAGMWSWVLGGAWRTWRDLAGRVDGGASPADAFCLAAYPLVVTGLLLFARSRGTERRPTALLDSAILTVGVGSLSWVFLIEPTLAASHASILSSLVTVAYPLGNVLLFGSLVRLAKAPGPGYTATRVAAGLVGAMLAFQSLAEAAPFATVVAVRPTPLDPRWLVVFVLAGAVALHPSMRAFSAPTPARAESAHLGQLISLAAALLIGPGILGGQLAAGDPLDAGPVVVTSTVLVLLVLVRMVRMVRHVHDQATTDDLTGLPNRRALYLQAAGRFADPQGHRQALLMLDLDRFKEVNDSLGHHAGDELLIQVGARLGAHLRAGDLLVRLGGDEFAIVLESAGLDLAVAVADRLRTALSEPFAVAEVTVHSRVSIGIALFPDHGIDLSTLLRKADIAMYRSKTSDAPHTYVGADDDRAIRLRTVDELRTALTENQFVVHYQPKIDLNTGVVHGVEALVRWDHPTRGLLAPGSFLDLVEESGLMPALTRAVLALALDQAAAWEAQRRRMAVAVNLSASSLVDIDLPEQVTAMLTARGLPSCVLQLEITEEFLMADRDRARSILTRLRRSGVQISIDDFGTGYSSLAYLRDLPIDELKLDRSFISPMADDARAVSLVASTVALAHSLDLRLVAEGVETADTCTELARLGCDQAQGFYISRPVPADELDLWLRDRTTVDVTAG
ncbi:MAG TPA: EAL domain-containing protein [Cellulomonadaceae bacterium]|nr:EAL domain-containing protein [Cellulomonadaceae bacterium]